MRINYSLNNQNGMRQWVNDFNQLDNRIRKKIMTASARKGLNETLKEARKEARRLNDPNSSNDISKNLAIIFKSKSNRRNGDFELMLGVLGGSKNPNQQNTTRQRGNRRTRQYATGGRGGSTYYWRFLEFGTRKMQARPFMIKSFIRTQTKVIEVFCSTFEQKINEITNPSTNRVP